MKISEKIDAIVDKNNSLVCVGLDTDEEKIPPHLCSSNNPLWEFNRAIIDATKENVCAYKLNLAFYEAAGEKGHQALRQTVDYIPNDIITIGDAKRGDIGNTARMYAKALFDQCGFDIVTVNAYMGLDAVEPFIADESRGVFVLCLTSNPSAEDFQIPDELYVKVAHKIAQWNDRGNCGAVVGATRPEFIARIRDIIGDAVMLIPGIGAQGGDLRQTLESALTPRGKGVIINSSRGIIYKSSDADFADSAREATLELKNAINKCRKGSGDKLQETGER